jgi:hypothetical protein
MRLLSAISGRARLVLRNVGPAFEYRYKSGEREAKEPGYAKTYSLVEAIFGSQRLKLPFEGLLLIGY